MSRRNLSQQMLDFRGSPPPEDQTLMGVFHLESERMGNPHRSMEGRLRSNHGNHRKGLGTCSLAGLPPKRPGKSGSTSRVYLIKFYLVVFSLASKYSETLEVLCVSISPAGSK